MKKILFGLLVAAALSVYAETDSYLYWMVNDGGTYTYDAVKIAAVDGAWNVNYLTVAADDGNFTALGDSVSKSSVAEASELGFGFYATVLGQYASNSYTFFVELWNDGVAVANSGEGMTWSVAQNYLASKSAMAPTEASWTTSTSSFKAGAIPEPTSGLLMLLGVAGLALRRRRA